MQAHVVRNVIFHHWLQSCRQQSGTPSERALNADIEAVYEHLCSQRGVRPAEDLVVYGQSVGSALVGQAFAAPGYLHPRPSAVGYDAASAGARKVAEK